MKNQTSNTLSQFYWTTTIDATWNSSKLISFNTKPNDSQYSCYFIDLSSIATWIGTINQIRFDPANGSDMGTILVDYIKIAANYESVVHSIGVASLTNNSLWIAGH